MDKNAYHYYGDTIRILFVVSGLIIAVSLPFFSAVINTPIAISIIASVILAVSAGMMNPQQRWIMFVNAIIAVSAFIFFEYSSVHTYLDLSPATTIHVLFFWTNQALSIIFFLAAYLSTKTLRGELLAEKNKGLKEFS